MRKYSGYFVEFAMERVEVIRGLYEVRISTAGDIEWRSVDVQRLSLIGIISLIRKLIKNPKLIHDLAEEAAKQLLSVPSSQNITLGEGDAYKSLVEVIAYDDLTMMVTGEAAGRINLFRLVPAIVRGIKQAKREFKEIKAI